MEAKQSTSPLGIVHNVHMASLKRMPFLTVE